MNSSTTRKIAAVATLLSLGISACGGSETSTVTTTKRARNAALNAGSMEVSKVVTKIQSGLDTRAVLTDDGRVYAWGDATSNKLAVPSLVAGATKFVDIAQGWNASIAIDDKNNLYPWGPNVSNYFSKMPALPSGATKWTNVWMAATWGVVQDDKGRLTSLSSRLPDKMPVLSSGATRWVSASMRPQWEYSYFIDDKGNVGWAGPSSALELPAFRNGGKKWVEFSVTDWTTLGLDDAGNIYIWSDAMDFADPYDIPQVELKGDAKKVVSAAYGAGAYIALDDLGQIYGMDLKGREPSLRNTPPLNKGASRFTSIAITSTNSASALDDKGGLYVWGSSNYGLNSIPTSLTRVAPTMPISASGPVSYGIDENGEISLFSDGGVGIGYPEGNDYIYIANGPRHMLAVTRSGTVRGWGANESGQIRVPTDLNNVVQVAAGFAYSAALKSDGTVVQWGSHVGTVTPMPTGLSGVKRLIGGYTNILAIKTDGTVVSWGDNSMGQTNLPSGLTDVISAAVADVCNAALKSDGSIVYWGACFTSARDVTSLPGAVSLAANRDGFAAIFEDGHIQVWGDEWSGVMDIPEDVTDVAALAGGDSYFIAVTRSGLVKVWGDTRFTNMFIPDSFSGMIHVEEDFEPYEGEGGYDGGDEGPVEEYVYTDEDASFLAEFIATLPPAQQQIILKKLGINIKDPVAQAQELVASIGKIPAAEVAQAATPVVTAQPTSQAATSTAATLPAAQSPTTKIGASVSTKAATVILSLKKVTKVSFVVPKTAGRTCTVSKSVVKATAAGSCTVQVKYTDAKKKTRTATLTLLIG